MPLPAIALGTVFNWAMGAWTAYSVADAAIDAFDDKGGKKGKAEPTKEEAVAAVLGKVDVGMGLTSFLPGNMGAPQVEVEEGQYGKFIKGCKELEAMKARAAQDPTYKETCAELIEKKQKTLAGYSEKITRNLDVLESKGYIDTQAHADWLMKLAEAEKKYSLNPEKMAKENAQQQVAGLQNDLQSALKGEVKGDGMVDAREAKVMQAMLESTGHKLEKYGIDGIVKSETRGALTDAGGVAALVNAAAANVRDDGKGNKVIGDTGVTVPASEFNKIIGDLAIAYAGNGSNSSGVKARNNEVGIAS